MEESYKEVYFGEYCQKCEYENYDENDTSSPCYDCMNEPINTYSHKPVFWKGKQGYEDYLAPQPKPESDAVSSSVLKRSMEPSKNIFNENGDYSGVVISYSVENHISKWDLLADIDVNGAYTKPLLIFKPDECAGKTLWSKSVQTETQSNGGLVHEAILIIAWDGLKEYSIGDIGLWGMVDYFKFPESFNKLVKEIRLRLWIRPSTGYNKIAKGSHIYADRLMMSWDEIKQIDSWEAYRK